MDLSNSRVLVLGLGITGLSTVKALHKLNAQIIVSDSKKEEELEDFFQKIDGIFVEKYLNTIDIPLEDIDLIIKSPGIMPTNPIILNARNRNIEVITDIELAYRISPTDNIIAITGTNGKTTTTALVGEIFKKAKYKTYLAGNIGVGILADMINAEKEDVFVVEASSFQLEDTIHFKPRVSLITNITPDHLDWHSTLDNYIGAKKKVFKNQGKNDYTVLNFEDTFLRQFEEEIDSKLIWFSANSVLDKGVFVEGDYIVIKDENINERVIPTGELKILGKHNLENALASVAIAYAMGVDLSSIREVLKEFPGVEHRIEYVKEIRGIAFYNDSKGTNPDSTIKAIEALNGPIILIAGGYDKGSDFDDLIKSFNGKVKDLILMGETKEKIKETALKLNFINVHLVDNMKEAVNLAYKLGKEKDNVLLSPACASWDMYNSFEERGKDFKNAVYNLEVE
ncbi:MAG: UDP-N-acetylmuramoyl-L-alanine--D-glutamate ligase [Tissierellia bacterium]|nr:UDP-N-acetylmuramoyl-L-alanine--D-glutamate ligase [Tissierellia bacterium]